MKKDLAPDSSRATQLSILNHSVARYCQSAAVRSLSDANSAPARKRLPLDVMLEVAACDAEALCALADTFAGARKYLWRSGVLRRALQADGCPAPQNSSFGDAGAAPRELLRLLRAHVAVRRLVPALGADPTWIPACGSAANLPRYSIAGASILQTQICFSGSRFHVRAAVYDLARHVPAWRTFTLARGWSPPVVSPEGGWALSFRHKEPGPVNFRLFALTSGDLAPRFESTFVGHQPFFSCDGRALLFAEPSAGTLRLRSICLGDGPLSAGLKATVPAPAQSALRVSFSPKGRRALVLDDAQLPNASVFDMVAASQPCTVVLPRAFDRADTVAWSADEDSFTCFQAEEGGAERYVLSEGAGTRHTFVTPYGDALRVSACDGDHLLTVRPDAESQVWQVYAWTQQAVSAALRLPEGPGSGRYLGQLFGTRALLALQHADTRLPPTYLYVDFAAPTVRTVALPEGHHYDLESSSAASEAWMVGKPRLGPRRAADSGCPSYQVVAVGDADAAVTPCVQVPAEQEDALQLSFDGKSMLVGRRDQGVAVYRLKP